VLTTDTCSTSNQFDRLKMLTEFRNGKASNLQTQSSNGATSSGFLFDVQGSVAK